MTQLPHIYLGVKDWKHWFKPPEVGFRDQERYFIRVGRPLTEAEKAAIAKAKVKL